MFIISAKKQLPYVTQNVALFTTEQFKPEYLKIDPKGVVPTPIMTEGVDLPHPTMTRSRLFSYNPGQRVPLFVSRDIS